MFRKSVALALGLNTLVSPALSLAASIPGFPGAVPLPSLATNTLPVVRGNLPTGVSISSASGSNSLVINQTSSQAIINWNSFNIGATSAVRFNQGTGTPGTSTWQPNSSFVALNRIYDQNPSLIYGKMSADGKVYLINQNGILFGPNSQVNVHTLIASTLNLRDGDFLNGSYNFTAENYQDQNYVAPKSDGTAADNLTIQSNLLIAPPSAQAVVANYGALQTDQGGRIYLLGPTVENFGSVSTPSGASRLIAALPLMQRPAGSALYDLQTFVDDSVTYNKDVTPGLTANGAGGVISADAGSIGLYGGTVNQEGTLSALTTIKNGGAIGLHATDLVYLAPGSQTSTPVSDAGDTLLETSNFLPGQITLTGITTDDSLTPYKALGSVQLFGSIAAPSGQVNIQAQGRVYLGAGSLIDVSGLWVNEAAGSNIVNAQLNSVELNNDYGQKNGVLQGQNVDVNPATGTAIGNISGNYTSLELTAQERSTAGGSVSIGNAAGSDPLAQLIVMNGATLNFAGGGYRFASGAYNTTLLAAGPNVVPISSASEWTSYNLVLGDQQDVSSKFGITKSYQGIYMGGGAPVSQLSNGYLQGADAGSATLQARLQVLDGTLNGSAVCGPYQTQVTTDPSARLLSVAQGLEEPLGGTLLIGTDEFSAKNPSGNDFILGATVISSNVPLLDAGFGPTDVLPPDRQQTTFISAGMLNGAGLSNLTVSSNTSLTVDAGATLELLPGASLSVLARSFDLLGSIRIPSGSVNVSLRDNLSESQPANPGSLPVDQRIALEDGSSIDVSGERIDNSLAGSSVSALANSRTGGGSIVLEDLTDLGRGVFVNKGSLLDVSGGYAIGSSGKLTGAGAGTLELMGNAVDIDGSLRGLALAGSAGGTLILQTGTVFLGPAGASARPGGTDAADDPGGLYLPIGTLADSGFSNLDIRSRGDLTLGSGLDLAPSLVRYTTQAQGSGGAVANGVNGEGGVQDIVVDPTIAGATSVTLAAGKPFDANHINPRDLPGLATDSVLTIASDSSVQTTAGGSIVLSGPAVAINGTLEALGGSILASASGQHDLVVGSGAKIVAAGYNRVDPTLVDGVPAGWSPQPGGSVSLSAALGSLDIGAGSLIDVSGSQPVQVVVKGADGRPTPTQAASQPGSVSLAYGEDLTLGGELRGAGNLAGLPGGALSIRDLNGELTLASAAVSLYQGWGFDDLTFGATGQIDFSGDLTITARRITLDTPLLIGAGASKVLLDAPWVQLKNSLSNADNAPVTLATGNAQLAITADWIDLTGNLAAAGFQQLRLTAQNDIRLTDQVYSLSQPVSALITSGYIGELNLAGDLVLDAARIYPTTLSRFSFDSAGKISVLANTSPSTPVVSAGGILTMDAANGIDVQGTLLAPMGQIVLNSSNGRVLLEPGSVVSSVGSSSVAYGALNAEGQWTIPDRDNPGQNLDVTAAPVQSIQITGKEVIVQNGARVDASGGGSVFAEVFQPGIEGSNNPLTVNGRYVILPDNSVTLPGRAVYLAGGDGVAPGVYSLLPIEYAFLPGARVVTDLGSKVANGAQACTAQGLPVVAGYFTDQGTNLHPSFYEGYTIQLASDLLKQGNFTTNQLVAGNGGSISLNGATTVLNGSVAANGLTGYSGGSLELGGTSVTVGRASAPLPAQFDFATPLPAGLAGTLLSTTSFVGKGFQSVLLGVSGETESVTVTAGSVVEVPNITVTATGSITLESGAQLRGVGSDDKGTVTLIAGDPSLAGATGQVTVADGALIHAGALFSLNVSTAAGATPSPVLLNGSVSVDHGTVSLTGDRITLVGDGAFDPSGGGIFLTPGQWSAFNAVSNLQLVSRGDLSFSGNLNLVAAGNVTLDAARISGTGEVSLSADGLNLLNSSGTTPGGSGQPQTGTLQLQANRIGVGTGDLLFDGFAVVRLLAVDNLTLQGTGTLKTGWSAYDPGQLLELQGAQIVSALAPTGSGSFSPAEFSVDAGFGTLAVTGSGTAATAVAAPGGYLSLTANQVAISGTITAPGGTLVVSTPNLNAGDPASVGIALSGGASLNLAGVSVTPAVNALPSSIPGGKVELLAGAGFLTMGPGTGIDVSGSSGSAAGSIVIAAPNSAVDLQGKLSGNSSGAGGGAFSLDAATIATPLDALFQNLAAGGFSSSVAIRQHSGDLTVKAGSNLAAGEIELAADSGSISVAGTLDASGAGSAGRVDLYAGNGVSIAGTVSTAGAGEVTLSSEAGGINLASGGSVELSGGGTLTLRAPWTSFNGGGVTLGGTITGASRVVLQPVQAYSFDSSAEPGGLTTLLGSAGPSGSGPNLGSTGSSTVYFQDLFNDANSSVQLYSTGVVNGLAAQSGLGSGLFLVRPEIEVRTGGDLALASDITLANASSGANPLLFGNQQSGVLTLRAAGNLTLDASIIDAPTPLLSLRSSNSSRGLSWGLTLVAGADLTGADPGAVRSAVQSGTGDLTIGDGVRVYTENGPLRFASGGDTLLGAGTSSAFIPNDVALTVGTYDGSISGKVAGDLTLSDGAVIQTATGALDLEVGGDLSLSTSAIRTTGEFTNVPRYFWTYGQGGNLSLDVTGDLHGVINPAAWDTVATLSTGNGNTTFWSPSILANGDFDTTEGIVTLGGGNLSIRSGKGFFGQAGTFGAGNLTLVAGGNVEGRFLSREGAATIVGNGNFGSADEPTATVLEDFGAHIDVIAGGAVILGSVINPSALLLEPLSYWDLSYTPDASVRLNALAGDITLVGSSAYANNLNNDGVARILPPSVELYAAGSINLLNNFILPPSATGTLRLAAGVDITGLFTDVNGQVQYASLFMSDQDPVAEYSYQRITDKNNPEVDAINGTQLHAATPVHSGDPEPVLISAGRDIRDLQCFLPKQADLLAGRDVRDIYALFQNVGTQDVTQNVTEVMAGRDIVFSAGSAAFQGDVGIVEGGPGLLLVQAGRNIDLGTSKGIQTIGYYDNPVLGTKGSTIIVAAGADDLTQSDADDFFATLRQAGSDYATLKADGSSAEAIALIDKTRTQTIDPLFSGGLNDGTGTINMINSSISTLSGKDDIYLLARSQINVGQSTFISDSQRQASGIFTASGGAINIFSGGDLNVNESRVMTYLGGDITTWSDQGSINAGRGSKTSVNSLPPQTIQMNPGENPPIYETIFTPPSAGSGIRALTYDLSAAAAGDIYLFAPQGVIDAGEAGIAGGKVTLGATEVLNAKNISFSSGSVGVPTSSDSNVSLGALSGAGSVAENSKMIEQASSVGGSKDKGAAQTEAVDDFMSRWLDLRIISFDSDDAPAADGDARHDRGKSKKK